MIVVLRENVAGNHRVWFTCRTIDAARETIESAGYRQIGQNRYRSEVCNVVFEVSIIENYAHIDR